MDIYGKVRYSYGGRSFCPFRYPGQYEDGETGLYYNRFRYYDPEDGVYVSQDPIGLAGGIFNLHAYVHDPNSWVDVLGLKNSCYNTPDDAARRILTKANKKAIKHNKEFGGLIFELNGKYYATRPIAGSGTTFRPGSAAHKVPKGGKVVGDYHTHGDYSKLGSKGNPIRVRDKSEDMFNSDEFSDSDVRIHNLARAGNSNHNSYLGTPSGQFKALKGGQVYEL